MPAKAKQDSPAKAEVRKPGQPRFPMCEGVREELERTGQATDPFTGERLTKDK